MRGVPSRVVLTGGYMAVFFKFLFGTVVLQKVPQSRMLTCPSTVTFRIKLTTEKSILVQGITLS